MPCRSISQAIANANAGDTIIVGPGKYGDLNFSGVLGDPGDESPPIGCSCMLAVNKPVILVSSDGAAVTTIDATTLEGTEINVSITSGGVQFGVPGHGFTVTNAGLDGASAGLAVVQADNVSISGNRIVRVTPTGAAGIRVSDQSLVLIEGNEIIAWASGILGRSNTSIIQNAVHAGFGIGIRARGSSVTENVVTDYGTGIQFDSNAQIIGNAVHGNHKGIETGPFSGDGKVEGNNIFGNVCGLSTDLANVVAENNYWGAATGPGADPADNVCGTEAGSADVTPFATKPFNVKIKVFP